MRVPSDAEATRSGGGVLDYADPLRRGTPREESAVSKKTKKRKLRARRNKANHGKRPNVGRR